jgi:hypothetical protein
VALAWYLDAERCEIYKDVDGAVLYRRSHLVFRLAGWTM